MELLCYVQFVSLRFGTQNSLWPKMKIIALLWNEIKLNMVSVFYVKLCQHKCVQERFRLFSASEKTYTKCNQLKCYNIQSFAPSYVRMNNGMHVRSGERVRPLRHVIFYGLYFVTNGANDINTLDAMQHNTHTTQKQNHTYNARMRSLHGRHFDMKGNGIWNRE